MSHGNAEFNAKFVMLKTNVAEFNARYSGSQNIRPGAYVP